MIAIGSDHAAYGLKEVVKQFLEEKGYEYKDVGTHGTESVHYPEYAGLVARSVASGECEKGILICGSGIGMSMAANKVRGVRAALCSEPLSASLSRQHNNANVLCMGARLIGEEMAKEIVTTWLTTPFSQGERHQQRIDMMEEQHETI